MLKDLFDACDCDVLDASLLFYGCKLKQQLGSFTSGAYFSVMSFDFRNMVLQLENYNEEIEDDEPIILGKFPFQLVIGEQDGKLQAQETTLSG